ncbi:hypothetical protein H4582DRAFT_2064366 [Lactarius indigo]|nr:hypothetical protein H4582DRAFT_2064366 [Lactarius indigo]
MSFELQMEIEPTKLLLVLSTAPVLTPSLHPERSSIPLPARYVFKWSLAQRIFDAALAEQHTCRRRERGVHVLSERTERNVAKSWKRATLIYVCAEFFSTVRARRVSRKGDEQRKKWICNGADAIKGQGVKIPTLVQEALSDSQTRTPLQSTEQRNLSQQAPARSLWDEKLGKEYECLGRCSEARMQKAEQSKCRGAVLRDVKGGQSNTPASVQYVGVKQTPPMSNTLEVLLEERFGSENSPK